MWNCEVTYDIQGEDGTRITCTSLQTLEKMVEHLKKDFEDRAPETVLIPFEFVVGSLFPDCFNNIKEMATHQYIEGYKEGLAKKEEGIEEDVT